MAAITTAITAVGVAAGIAGTVMNYQAQKRQAALQNRQIDVQEEGAKIEAARQRRQIFRDVLRAQATSESTAAAGNATEGSGLAGGLMQAANSGAQSTRDVNQNLGMALNLSSLQKQSLNTGQAEAGLVSGLGSGLQSIGSTLTKNQTQIQRTTSALDWLYR